AAQLAAVLAAERGVRAASALARRAFELHARTDWAAPFRASPPPPGALSPREVEVAQLAASGARSKEVAELLSVSVRTVENTLQRVYAKLGIQNRAELKRELGDAPRPTAATEG
ncbi:MAG: hypothetical protein JWM05_1927, partial [Acidimicrobiales bacterium]|nr:hypothetical protein [Acidimicrobiales bacterium]